MAAKLGLVGLGNLALFLNPEVNLVWENFHIWRPITSLFAYPITPQTGFHYLMMLYFLYQYSNRLEKDDFAGKPADMSYMLLIIYAVTSKLHTCHKCHCNKTCQIQDLCRNVRF